MLSNITFRFSTLVGLFLLLLVVACSKDSFIDAITPLEAGADTAAPTVVINYPVEGTRSRYWRPLPP